MRNQQVTLALWALVGLMALVGMGFAYHHGNPKKTAIVVYVPVPKLFTVEPVPTCVLLLFTQT